MAKPKHSADCYPVGFALFTPKYLMRRGVSIRYVVVKNVIWLLKIDIVNHYKQLKENVKCVKQ